MATIALFPHPDRPEAVAVATATMAWLTEEGHRAFVVQEELVSPDEVNAGEGAADLLPASVAHELDLAVSLGGDGTMLRVVREVGPYGVPVLGVNVGHLGFLSEVGPGELPQALKEFLAGEYRLVERMTLAIEVRPRAGGPPSITTALNDAVLQRTSSGHTVRLEVSLCGSQFLTYAADSLIVATPTGSTAYNLSARGPIASPSTRLLVMTPVAAHMLFDRSLVLGGDADVTFRVVGSLPVELVVDGKSLGCLATGDEVHCRAGDYDARFVEFGGRTFFDILKHKFGTPER